MKTSASWKALAEAIEACAQALRAFYPLGRDFSRSRVCKRANLGNSVFEMKYIVIHWNIANWIGVSFVQDFRWFSRWSWLASVNKVCWAGDIFLLFLNSQRGGPLYHGLFNTCLCCATERKYHEPLELERMMYDVLSQNPHTQSILMVQ